MLGGKKRSPTLRGTAAIVLGEKMLKRPQTSCALFGRILFLTGAAVMATAPALAQGSRTTSAQQAFNEGDAETPSLDAIVVTAQRREEKSQSVPITVSAFNGAALQAAGIITTRDITFITPGFQVGQQLGSQILNIRGVGSQSGSAGDEASVSMYIDGFYITDARATIFDLNNVERVEVLKGPQGTLFGRNSVGGLMQIVTKTPSFEPHLEASVGYGNYDTAEAKLYATAGAGKVAADVAISYRNQNDGFGRNLVTGKDTLKTQSFAARTKWLFDLSDDFKQTLAFDYSNFQSSMGVARKLTPTGYGVRGYQMPAGSGFYDIASNFEPDGSYKQWGISSRTEWNLPKFDIINLAQYRSGHGLEKIDQDSTPITAAHFNQYTMAKYYTEELQVVSNADSRFKWMLGAFYFHYHSGYDPIQFVGNSNTFGIVDTESLAGYGQATVDVGWNTNLTAGLRFTHDRRAFTGRTVSLATGAVIATVAPTVETPSSSDRLTWKFAIDHHFTDDAMVYASYSRGFKSGIYQATNLANPLVEPETLDAYEVGLKSDWLDGKLRINGSLFHYIWKNIQLTQVIQGGAFQLNAAAGRINGAEIEIQARPVRGLNLRGNASLIDSKYTNFPNGPCWRGPNPAGGDIKEPLPPAGRASGVAGSCDLSGNQLLRTPKATFTVGFDYSVNTNIGKFELSSTYYFNGGFYWEAENRLKQKSYGLLSSQLGWSPDDRWRVRLWGKNLLGKRYSSFSTSSGALGDFYSPGEPRTYGLAVDLKI